MMIKKLFVAITVNGDGGGGGFECLLYERLRDLWNNINSQMLP